MLEWLQENKGAATVVVAALGVIGGFIGLLTALVSRKKTHEIILKGERSGPTGAEAASQQLRSQRLGSWRFISRALWLCLLMPGVAKVGDWVLGIDAVSGAESGAWIWAKVFGNVAYTCGVIFSFLGIFLVPLFAVAALFSGLQVTFRERSPLVFVHLGVLLVLGWSYFIYAPAVLSDADRPLFPEENSPQRTAQQPTPDPVVTEVAATLRSRLSGDWNADGQTGPEDVLLESRFVTTLALADRAVIVEAILGDDEVRTLELLVNEYLRLTGGDVTGDGDTTYTLRDQRVLAAWFNAFGRGIETNVPPR